ncbi:MAG TPA: hypothetical protein VIX60_04625 [Candidatus Cybelea sp.]
MRSLFSGAQGAAFIALPAFLLALAFGTAAVAAKGTVTVLQTDGHVDVYKDVSVKVMHDALFMTTADGKGTLAIHRAACSYQAELMVCFVTSALLVQAGKTRPLDFKIGTLYVNATDAPQQLVLSTKKVAPHSILLSFTTKRGTYVTMSGRIDKVVR